jgi:hypothetical protein
VAKGSNIDDFLKELDELETLIPSPFETKDTLETLRNRIDWLYQYLSNTGGGNANRNIQLDGVNILRPFTDINLIAGSGVTITASANQTTKYTDITFSAAGATIASEIPVGAVDGVNTVYTVAHEPLFVMSDGMFRVNGYGYTYAAGTITMDALIPPVQYIISYYSA